MQSTLLSDLPTAEAFPQCIPPSRSPSRSTAAHSPSGSIHGPPPSYKYTISIGLLPRLRREGHVVRVRDVRTPAINAIKPNHWYHSVKPPTPPYGIKKKAVMPCRRCKHRCKPCNYASQHIMRPRVLGLGLMRAASQMKNVLRSSGVRECRMSSSM
jgi:hypothetical protein